METEAQCEVVDPTKLLSRDGVLGYERGGGFERVTNFDLEVIGYVGDDDGEVIGYIVRIIPSLRDPLFRENYSFREMFLSNRQLGNNSALIKRFTEGFPALWIAQAKDTFLPQFVYNRCSAYMHETSEDLIKRFKLVSIVGKQPNDDTWVFNPTFQIDGTGKCIAPSERKYVTSERSSLPYLWNVNNDLDNGEALKDLFGAERELFMNNYHKVLLTHAASSMAANYHSMVKNFDGCSLPVLRGLPVSGKTTALKAVLSVFGLHNFSSESSSRFIESKQASTTIPFGWDDASNINILNNIAVNSFNACGSSTMKSTLKPHTVPIVTTNLDTSEAKINSRWLRIPFETLSPLLRGREKHLAENKLKKAMENAYKSIRVVTVSIHNAINNHSDDDDYFSILADVEEEIDAKYTKGAIDARVKESTVVALFCLKKILDNVGLSEEYQDVWDTMKNSILPSYVINEEETGNAFARNVRCNEDKVETILRESLPKAILKEEKDQAMTFFENEYNPYGCMCGTSVAFHVKSMKDFLESKLGKECMGSINENSIRSFVKKRQIGCTGVLTKFRGKDRQIHAIHIGRSWFKLDDLDAFDLKFGKRPKQSNQKQGASAAKQRQYAQSEPNKEEELVNQPTAVNEKESNQPTVVNEEERNLPIVLNEKESNQPTVVNEEERNLPAVLNEKESSQPTMVNEEQRNQPTVLNVKESNQPIVVNEEERNLPTVVNEEERNQPTLVNEEERNQPTILNVKESNQPIDMNERAGTTQTNVVAKRSKRRSPVDSLYDKVHVGVVEGKRKRAARNDLK